MTTVSPFAVKTTPLPEAVEAFSRLSPGDLLTQVGDRPEEASVFLRALAESGRQEQSKMAVDGLCEFGVLRMLTGKISTEVNIIAALEALDDVSRTAVFTHPDAKEGIAALAARQPEAVGRLISTIDNEHSRWAVIEKNDGMMEVLRRQAKSSVQIDLVMSFEDKDRRADFLMRDHMSEALGSGAFFEILSTVKNEDKRADVVCKPYLAACAVRNGRLPEVLDVTQDFGPANRARLLEAEGFARAFVECVERGAAKLMGIVESLGDEGLQVRSLSTPEVMAALVNGGMGGKVSDMLFGFGRSESAPAVLAVDGTVEKLLQAGLEDTVSYFARHFAQAVVRSASAETAPAPAAKPHVPGRGGKKG